MAEKTQSGAPSPSSGAPADADDQQVVDTEVPMPSVVASSLPPSERGRVSASEDVAPIQRRIGELRKLVVELLEAVEEQGG